MHDENWFFRWFNQLSSAQLLLLFHILAIVFSTSILLLPIAYKDGAHVAFMAILFVSVSALSVTVLTPISVSETFTTAGGFILSLLMHVGAVVVLSVITFICILFGTIIGISEE